MDYSNYVRKKQRPRQLAYNILITGVMSVCVLLILYVSFSELTYHHFSERNEVFVGSVVDIIQEESSLITPNFENEINAITNEFGINDGCRNLGLLEEGLIKDMVRDACEDGVVTREELVTAMNNEAEIQFFSGVELEFLTKYNEAVEDTRQKFLSNQEAFFPILNNTFLVLILSFMIYLHLLNNNNILTIRYISKKMVFMGFIVFIIPYFMFKLQLLSYPLKYLDFTTIVDQLPVTVGENLLPRLVDYISYEFSILYTHPFYWGVVLFIMGSILYFGNRFILFKNKFKYMDLLVKDTIIKPTAKDKKEVKKEVKKAVQETKNEK